MKLQWDVHLQQIEMNHVIRMLTLSQLEVFTWEVIFTKARQVYSAVVRSEIAFEPSVWHQHDKKDELLSKEYKLEIDWLRWVESLRLSRVFNSSRLDSSQNFEIEYSSWVMMFESSIQVKLKCWNWVLIWILNSTRQDMKQSTTNIHLNVW